MMNNTFGVSGQRDKIWESWLLPAVAVATFGPYLSGGIRSEQIAVYCVAGLTAVFMPWKLLRAAPAKESQTVMIIWGSYFAIAAMGVLFPIPAEALSFPGGNALAGADNLLLPLACVLITLMYVRTSNRALTLQRICGAAAILSAANAVVAFAMISIDLTPYLRSFWASASVDGRLTVSEMAQQLGRVGGIFGQPADAGLMYGLGGLTAIYAWSDKPRRLFPVLAIIFVGGALSVSKIFLLVAAPILLWQVWRLRNGKMATLFTIAIGTVVVAQSGLFDQWRGVSYLTRLLNPVQGNFLQLYSANRLGAGSSLFSQYEAVLGLSPLAGIGLGGWQVAYDNGLMEALVYAGIVGVCLYVSLLVVLVKLATRLKGAEARLAWGLTLLTAFGSVGLPTLTDNRSSTILWLLFGVLAARLPRNGQPFVAPHASVRPLSHGRHHGDPPAPLARAEGLLASQLSRPCTAELTNERHEGERQWTT